MYNRQDTKSIRDRRCFMSVACIAATILALVAISMSAPVLAQAAQNVAGPTRNAILASMKNKEINRMWMTVGERRFAITLADTEAAREFAAMLPLTIDMPDLNNNEKHAELPKSLPTDASRPGTIHNGDLMLYGSQTLVVFYVTFNSSYSYTRLGRVDDSTDLAQALGSGTARITFSRN